MSLDKDLSKLLDAGVISEETAEKIQTFYLEKKGDSSGRMFLVFGILGALLAGLGIILIIAHNWDDLSRSAKTGLSFLPLVLGQITCLFALLKRNSSSTWREGSSTFLFFAVGASISLISQIYHIQGDFDSFMFIWMLLCLPAIYLMRSSMTSLLYLIGITTFAVSAGYESNTMDPYFYCLLFLATLPHYYLLYKKNPTGNFLILHHWLLPLSVIICLGTIHYDLGEYLIIAYTSLFGFYFLIGQLDFFKNQILRNNSYLVFGAIGTIFMMLLMSFGDMWNGIYENIDLITSVTKAPEFYGALLLTGASAFLLMRFFKQNKIESILPLGIVFIVFVVLFMVGIWLPIGALVINLVILTIGIWIVKTGANQSHLGQLNFGLLTVAILIACRFFDTDLSYVMRGVLFLIVGVGFFGANYWMLKKRKADEK